MNRSAVVSAAEFVVAVLCLAGAVLCWNRGVQVGEFPARGDIPAFAATRYAGPWLLAAVISVTGAALFALDICVRVVRLVRGGARVPHA
ncbi:hypothetical protein [Nocardia paucivorans]|uniref:hypothetical protein n=1 Tax=Nocardia paucivorans TaxID=114259 RepID=UPI0002D7FC7A|nr:hypothetical protein [Nocardia paucivorans]